MPLSKIEVPSLDVGQLGSRNLLINGDFKISQRGDYTSATSATHNQLYVDRWLVRQTNVTSNIQHILGSHASPNYPYKASNSLKLTATSTATGLLRHLQRVEGFLDGQTLTFSAWVKSNSPNARLYQYQHDGQYRVSSSAHSGNGQWEFLSVTATNAATTTNNLYFDAAIGSSTFAHVSITSGDYIEISEAQVEISDAPTTFEYESIGTTLQKCQRYYYAFQITNDPTGQNSFLATAYSANTMYAVIDYPVQMRTEPSLVRGGTWHARNGNNNSFTMSAGFQRSGRNNGVIAQSSVGSSATSDAYWVEPQDGTGYLSFDAEL